MDFWRGEAYSKFFDHLESKGGFYYEVRLTSAYSPHHPRWTCAHALYSGGATHPCTASARRCSHARIKYTGSRTSDTSTSRSSTARSTPTCTRRRTAIVIRPRASVSLPVFSATHARVRLAPPCPVGLPRAATQSGRTLTFACNWLIMIRCSSALTVYGSQCFPKWENMFKS